MPTLMLIGLGCIAWSIGALLIELSPYRKHKDIVTGIITYTEKKTGRKFVILPGGYSREL